MDQPISVIDVAAYILHKKGSMSSMKLQKLVYYCQAWSLVWDDAPLFREDIEAWRDGPVVRELFYRHKGQFVVSHVDGDASALSASQAETVEAVLADYGNSDGATLSQMTHDEAPWQEVRRDLPEGVNSDHVITHASMKRFYSSL